MKVLIIGGAGFIGSHMAKLLSKGGHNVVSFDNLSSGYRELARYGKLVIGDLNNYQHINDLFSQHSFDVVMHFAASIVVSESVINPGKYYRNNLSNTLNLLDVMVMHGVKKLIFSSTAAIYGEPKTIRISEDHQKKPINPYGTSKLMVETVLGDYAKAYGLNFISLRYFNAAGSDPEIELGLLHEPVTHLIPLVLQVASGRKKSINVFGKNYHTKDGTCVRDFIHIQDLCSAHILAMEALDSEKFNGGKAFNLGNGNGFTVMEVIDTAKRIVAKEGFNINVKYGKPRDGDSAVLVAEASKARNELNWRPEYNDLPTIINHAWQWEKKLAGI